MSKPKLESYLNLRYSIKDILYNKNIDYETIEYIKKILRINEYEKIDSAKFLYNYIINDKSTSKLKYLLENLYFDLITNFEINLYSYNCDSMVLFNKKYLKKDIYNIKNTNFITNQDAYNILIKKDKNYTSIDKYFDYIYYYNDIFNYIELLCKYIYLDKYNYYYLKNELRSSISNNIDILLLGLSYPLYGFDKKRIEFNSTNLCLPSQDLYYSYKLLNHTLFFKKNITVCILGIGYYSFHFDLSKSNENYRIESEYFYTLNDSHNIDIKANDRFIYEKVAEKQVEEKDKLLHQLFNFNNLQEDFINLFFNKHNSYFNEEFAERIGFGLPKNKSFKDLSIDEKIAVAKVRTDGHNKFIKYNDTLKENTEIFFKMLNLLEKNKIKPIVVLFPFTKYYIDLLDPEYYKCLNNIINKAKERYDFQFINFNQCINFTDNDFVDADHLSNSGCIKISDYINKYLKMHIQI